MKRKMVYAGASWTAGMFMASVLSPDMQIPAMLILLLVSAFFFWKTAHRFVYFAVSAVFFISGALYFTFNSHVKWEKIRSFSGQEVFFEGTVTEAEDRGGGKSAYRLHGRINSDTAADLYCCTDTLGAGYSDRISFYCTPSEFENTFLFNSRDYYGSEGCFLQADGLREVKTEENTGFSPVRTILRYREYAAEKTAYILPGEYGAVITAMLLGDKSSLDGNTRKELYRCGTGHMMAVSGMHLVLVISAVSSLLMRTGLSGRKRFLVTEAAVAVFVIFSGVSVSVTRAALMMTLVYSAGLFGRKTDPLNSLCTALFVMLLFRPYLAGNSSFLLSAAGTYGATVLVPYVTEKMKTDSFADRLKKRLVSVFCISVCVFPFTVMFFDEASLVSPVTDILIIPLLTFAFLCGAGAAFTGFADVTAYPLLMAGGLAVKLVLRISSFISGSGLASVTLKRGYVPLLTLFLVLFVILTSLRFRSRRSTLTAVVLSVFIFMGSSFLSGFLNRKVLSVYRVGTPSASAVVVSMGRCTDVIDLTGGAKTSRYVEKLTDVCGIQRIDSLSVLKNPYQSMASFSDRLRVNDVSHVYVPEDTFTGSGTRVCGCSPEHFPAEGIRLERNGYTVSADSGGNVSVEYGGNTIRADVSGIETGDGYFTDFNIAVRESDSGRVKVYKLG